MNLSKRLLFTRFTISVFAVSFLFVAANAQTTPRTAATPSATPTPGSSFPQNDPRMALQLKIMAKLNSPTYQRGSVGLKAVSLKTGKIIYEHNADKYFMPASNMKNFTVATALDKLTPDFKFVTSVYSATSPDANGVLSGDLRIYGRGDISRSYTFYGGDHLKGLEDIANKIVAAGVRSVEGSLVADDSYFEGSATPAGWEWDDMQWYYGAEVSSLPVNDNVIELSVRPGPSGYQCTATVSPFNYVVKIVNQCTTTPLGSRRTLKITKSLDSNEIVISGTLPTGDSGFKNFVAVSRPAELYASLLKEILKSKGVTVKGPARASNVVLSNATPAIELARVESPPLSIIAAQTMKPSQNMYTEVLLRTLGKTQTLPSATSAGNADTQTLGINVVRNFLKEIGTDATALQQYDGSGLSRHNLVTPSVIVDLYRYMALKSRSSQAWRDSLTVGGVDGTLRNRFKGTSAMGNVRGKTGTIDQVSALSGYVKTKAGEEIVFSLLVNGIPENRTRVALIDEIVLYLADFDGSLEN